MRLTELVTPLKLLDGAGVRGDRLRRGRASRALIRQGETGTLFIVGDPEALVCTV